MAGLVEARQTADARVRREAFAHEAVAEDAQRGERGDGGDGPEHPGAAFEAAEDDEIGGADGEDEEEHHDDDAARGDFGVLGDGQQIVCAGAVRGQALPIANGGPQLGVQAGQGVVGQVFQGTLGSEHIAAAEADVVARLRAGNFFAGRAPDGGRGGLAGEEDVAAGGEIIAKGIEDGRGQGAQISGVERDGIKGRVGEPVVAPLGRRDLGADGLHGIRIGRAAIKHAPGAGSSPGIKGRGRLGRAGGGIAVGAEETGDAVEIKVAADQNGRRAGVAAAIAGEVAMVVGRGMDFALMMAVDLDADLVVAGGRERRLQEGDDFVGVRRDVHGAGHAAEVIAAAI